MRSAKRMGAPGFRASGAVEPLPLLAWLLTKGKKTDGIRSLDQARAGLADAQRIRLEREEQLMRGNMVPVIWVDEVLAEHLERLRIWVRERLSNLGWMVAHVAGITDEKRREEEVKRWLNDDANQILTMLSNSEGLIRQALRKGPPDGPGRTATGEIQAILGLLRESVSPAARAELDGFVAKLRSERTAPEPTSATPEPTPATPEVVP